MYYSVLYCIVLYYIVLYYIVLFCILLYYIVLYCNILYYIVLYCIILYYYIVLVSFCMNICDICVCAAKLCLPARGFQSKLLCSSNLFCVCPCVRAFSAWFVGLGENDRWVLHCASLFCCLVCSIVCLLSWGWAVRMMFCILWLDNFVMFLIAAHVTLNHTPHPHPPCTPTHPRLPHQSQAFL